MKFTLTRDWLHYPKGHVFETTQSTIEYTASAKSKIAISIQPHEISLMLEVGMLVEGDKLPQWKPTPGETFYYYTMDGKAKGPQMLPANIIAPNQNQYWEFGAVEFGNCFKTKKEAEEAALRVKEAISVIA